jgi:hypothetical protein
MADVYRLSASGGPDSPRFKRYVEILRETGLPISGYNPMTSKPALETVEALLAIDAETIAEEIARDVTMFITVATPGMWTDRIATEIEHRFQKRSPEILLWTGEDVNAHTVRTEAFAQLVRMTDDVRTTAEVAMREGRAYAMCGCEGEPDEAAAEALRVVGDDTSVPTTVALLYGDEAAKVMGFTPLGLGDHAGYRHCIAVAAETLRD